MCACLSVTWSTRAVQHKLRSRTGFHVGPPVFCCPRVRRGVSVPTARPCMEEQTHMPKIHRSGPGPDVVTAARAGDRPALEHLVTQCLPLVYNIVGRALNGHADVDDVVQETLLRMVRGLPKLRDPSAFRSWLVAITVRQVRNREQSRATDRDRRAHLDDAEAITDPALDFAGLTILRLGLTEQRREVAEATRWLDPDDQELLSLWWLEETGELERAELAGALGLSDRMPRCGFSG